MQKHTESVSGISAVEGKIKPEEKEKVKSDFERAFSDLNLKDQQGVVTLLQKLNLRGFGELLISEIFSKVPKLNEDEAFCGPIQNGKRKDNRIESLAVLSSKENDSVGQTLTVSDVFYFLKEKGKFGWSDE